MTISADDETMARDVHPAQILLPSGDLLQDARIFVTSHRVIIWKEDATRRPYVAAEIPIAQPRAVNPSKNTLNANELIEIPVDGGIAHLRRGRGCGCGNTALKALGHPAPWGRGRQA